MSSRLLIALVLVAVAVAAALWIQRRRPARGPAPTATDGTPAQLDRSDLRAPPDTWVLVVFVSPDCEGCGHMLQVADELRAGPAAVEVVTLQEHPELQRRYGITAVPTTVLADGDGMVHRSWVGRVRTEVLRGEIAEAMGSR